MSEGGWRRAAVVRSTSSSFAGEKSERNARSTRRRPVPPQAFVNYQSLLARKLRQLRRWLRLETYLKKPECIHNGTYQSIQHRV